jgi:hypothetical protein
MFKINTEVVGVRSFQDDKIEGKIVEVVCVRSFQDDKFEGKIVEVDCK